MGRLFLDTEFTDLLSSSPSLISLALVAEDARALYLEFDGWTSDTCSRFVKEVVLPRLVVRAARVSWQEAAWRLAAWIRDLGEPAVLVADSGVDWY
jgi:hypothetical protein